MNITPPPYSRIVQRTTNPVDLVVSTTSDKGSKLEAQATRLGVAVAQSASFADALTSARAIASEERTAMAVLSAKDGAFLIAPIWHAESRVVGADPHVSLDTWSRKTMFGRTYTYAIEGAYKQMDALQAVVAADRFADLRTSNLATFQPFSA